MHQEREENSRSLGPRMSEGMNEMEPDDFSRSETHAHKTRGEDPGPQSLKLTLARLKDAQKPPYGVAAWSRFVNRPLGRYFAAAAYHGGLTPNQVSIVSGVFTYSGIVLIAVAAPRPLVSVLVGILLVIGYAIDSADGQVARLTGRGSLLGEWLDHMLDCAKIASIHLAVLVHLYRFADNLSGWKLLLPLAYSIVGSVLFFGVILTDQLRRASSTSGLPRVTGSTSLVRSFLLIPVDFGVLACVLALLFWQSLFFVAYVLLFVATAGSLLIAIRGWVKALRALDRARESRP